MTARAKPQVRARPPGPRRKTSKRKVTIYRREGPQIMATMQFDARPVCGAQPQRRFWICDFGFWIENQMASNSPSKIGNPNCPRAILDFALRIR
jgi:hypothetical protein